MEKLENKFLFWVDMINFNVNSVSLICCIERDALNSERHLFHLFTNYFNYFKKVFVNIIFSLNLAFMQKMKKQHTKYNLVKTNNIYKTNTDNIIQGLMTFRRQFINEKCRINVCPKLLTFQDRGDWMTPSPFNTRMLETFLNQSQ